MARFDWEAIDQEQRRLEGKMMVLLRFRAGRHRLGSPSVIAETSSERVDVESLLP